MSTQERRHAERRVSPAVGEHAILECAKLRASNAELLAALHLLEVNGALTVAYNVGTPQAQLAIELARAALAKAEEK